MSRSPPAGVISPCGRFAPSARWRGPGLACTRRYRILINETEGMASASVYSHRFGSLPRAYTLIAFTPDRDYGFLEINRLLRRLHPEIVQRAEAEIIAIGGHIQRDAASDLLRINDEFTVSIVLARCLINARGGGQWKIRLYTSLCPDITIAVRLDQQNAAALVGIGQAAVAALVLALVPVDHQHGEQLVADARGQRAVDGGQAGGGGVGSGGCEEAWKPVVLGLWPAHPAAPRRAVRS